MSVSGEARFTSAGTACTATLRSPSGTTSSPTASRASRCSSQITTSSSLSSTRSGISSRWVATARSRWVRRSWS